MSNITNFSITNEISAEQHLERTQKTKNFHHIVKRTVFQFRVKAIKRKIKPKKVIYFKKISDIFITGRTPEYNQNALSNRIFNITP